jgi:hypothetical protein
VARVVPALCPWAIRPNELHVAEIDASTVARVLAKVDRESVSMSKKVRTRVRAIFDHAITEGPITSSPVPVTRRRMTGAKRNDPAVLERDGVGNILRDARTWMIPRSKGHVTADALEKFCRRTLGLQRAPHHVA